jgi:hypothetical protein
MDLLRENRLAPLNKFAAIRTGGADATVYIEFFDVQGNMVPVGATVGPTAMTVTSTAKTLAELVTNLPPVSNKIGQAYYAKCRVASGGGIACNYGAGDAKTMPTTNTPMQFEIGDQFEIGKVTEL